MAIKFEKKYFENIDASRFYAFLLVFCAHGFVAISSEIKTTPFFIELVEYFKIGFLGLEYFFVLSSFLISWTILEEKEQTSHFKMFPFLIRRALRVWPLYFLVIIIAYFISFSADFFHFSLQPLPPIEWFVFFAANYYIIEYGNNFLFFLAFLWSLSAEEQFYVFWAIVMKFLKINLLWLSLVLISISLVFRFSQLHYGGSGMDINTLSILGNFGVGGLFAYFAFNQTRFFQWMLKVSKSFYYLIYLSIFLILIVHPFLKEEWIYQLVSKIVISFLFGFYIIELAFRKDKVLAIGNNETINYLGKISYGLYCYHGIIITILLAVLPKIGFQESFWHSLVLYPTLILLATTYVAHLSYKFIERPFLKAKRHFY